MDYITFGKYLLDTYDLDPLYAILVEVGMPERMLKRFLLGYMIFYSVGVAAKVAESKNFWKSVMQMDIDHAPRGHERRHMRGQAFQNCIQYMMSLNLSPDAIIDRMANGSDFQTISSNVQEFCGFGPWISFKFYDLMDRVLQLATDKEGVDLYMYKDPVKGAALYKFHDQKHKITKQEVHDVVGELLGVYRRYKAPPFLDRPLSVMEIETCMCKAKANFNGHYPLGNDVIEIYHGLEGYGDLAQQLKQSLQPYYDYWMEGYTWEQRNVKITV